MDFLLNAGGTTMTQTACFRRPAAETPADLGQVTGERISLTAFAKPTQTQGQETRYRKTCSLLPKTCCRNVCSTSRVDHNSVEFLAANLCKDILICLLQHFFALGINPRRFTSRATFCHTCDPSQTIAPRARPPDGLKGGRQMDRGGGKDTRCAAR